jgi:hypothetical protein
VLFLLDVDSAHHHLLAHQHLSSLIHPQHAAPFSSADAAATVAAAPAAPIADPPTRMRITKQTNTPLAEVTRLDNSASLGCGMDSRSSSGSDDRAASPQFFRASSVSDLSSVVSENLSIIQRSLLRSACEAQLASRNAASSALDQSCKSARCADQFECVLLKIGGRGEYTAPNKIVDTMHTVVLNAITQRMHPQPQR